MAKILRVNMNDCSTQYQAEPAQYALLGGRGLTSQMILDEVDPKAYPLNQKNKLIIAPGLLAGTNAPSSGRLSIGAKSPLTGGIKESNAGGTVARKLANLALKAIVVEGKPTGGQRFILKISVTGAQLVPADDFWGLGNYQTVSKLQAEYGNKVSIISIGQAGEHQMLSASIAITDLEGRPCRHCGRGGLGAVMGSKGLKAIVIDDNQSKEPLLPLADQSGFNKTAKEWAQVLVEKSKVLTTYGTSITLNGINAVGGLPTRNFSRGQYEQADKINGHALVERINANGGKTGHPCSPGCVIRCSNIYKNSSGEYVTSGLEYETLCLFGSNCEIDDLDAIAQFDFLCDDYGLDTMEMGATMAVAMEAGLLEFGDASKVVNLLKEISEATVLGRVLGQGAAVTGKVFNVSRVPVVKGQALASYDPRVLKGTGVTYATSPMGADHTAGNCLPGRGNIDHKNAEGQVAVSRDIQIYSTVLDIMGLCNFTGADSENMDIIAQLLTKALGKQLSSADVIKIGQETINNEIKFNSLVGLTNIDNRLPEFFLNQSLSPSNMVFDVNEQEIDSIFMF